MARIPTTFDSFSAIAEPKRRLLIEILAVQELSVSEIVQKTTWRQPSVSKHLGVLRKVGLLIERRKGKERYYKADIRQLKPIEEWVSQFKEHWENNLDNLESYLTELQSKKGKNE